MNTIDLIFIYKLNNNFDLLYIQIILMMNLATFIIFNDYNVTSLKNLNDISYLLSIIISNKINNGYLYP